MQKNTFNLRVALIRIVPSALLAFALVTAAHAQTVTPSEKPYVGGYTSGTVDTRTQLMLLDDNTFCVTFMGGSLDMLVGGRWKEVPGSKGVRLVEERQVSTLFPAFTRKPEEGDRKGAVIELDGHSMSRANAPVFGVSGSDAPPAALRPLFPPDMNNWSGSYTLPPMPSAQVASFFIGDVETDRERKPVRVKVTQYRLGNAPGARVGFDESQARTPLNLEAVLNDNILSVDGERFGKRDELPNRILEGIRTGCIRPALDPAGALARETVGPDDTPDVADSKRRVAMRRANLMVPVKTFYMDLIAIQGVPYFSEGEK